jgi:tRNA U34 5-methylaminomethyl-2-thiouridine-forming methyltransferase MnmC
VHQSGPYRLVKLAGGVHSVHSVAHRETFHPVIGPVAEAEALYVRQLRLLERLRAQPGQFVIWDVGLGAAANALTVLRAARRVPCSIRLVSFDHTIEPLQFALDHAGQLGYFQSYEDRLHKLLKDGRVTFQDDALSVDWELRLGDFPSLVRSCGTAPRAARPPAPGAILFDAYSPARNPAMWTQPLFAGLFDLLDPVQPCALPTYSRSTMLRVSLLLAGFYVGVGHATGEKEQTTIAANTLDLVEEPLGERWLQRACHSTSAEPLWEPVYRQAPLTPETWARLRQHPQFRGGVAGTTSLQQ